MKRAIIVISFFWLVFPATIMANGKGDDMVLKSYTLKFINPEQVQNALHIYTKGISFDKTGNIITVRIAKKNVTAFEKLLKEMDVERKKMLLRVFSVIGSHKAPQGEIKNPDLSRVLTEVKKLLNFSAFKMDGVSAITLTDGQKIARLRLQSQYSLRLDLIKVQVRDDNHGNGKVTFDFNCTHIDGKGNPTLMKSLATIKKDGYLVAGVSKLGDNGEALILIMNAEMK